MVPTVKGYFVFLLLKYRVMVTTVKGYFENSVSSHLQKNLDQCLVDNNYRALSRVEIGYKASSVIS